MRFLCLMGVFLSVMFSARTAMAGDTDLINNCTASAFLTDFRDDFRSERDAFDWCFRRVQWWGLDTRDGWRDRFCRVSRYSSGYNNRWRAQFWHHFGDFSDNTSRGIWGRFGDAFGDRLFQGWTGRVQFHFGEHCRGGYD
jgi:hypothetical protein